MKQLIAANWKMNSSLAMTEALLGELRSVRTDRADILICPPFPYLLTAKAALAGSSLFLGAQNCHSEKSGAFTGEVAAPMLKDCGCSHVILGHSERRQYFGEKDNWIQKKAIAAQAAGLVPVICVGENAGEREAGIEKNIVKNQIVGSIPESGVVVIAYEPVWAIGTGKTANDAQIAEMHQHIDQVLQGLGRSHHLILYGGSVKAENANAILALPYVGGALVGGASLKAEDFLAIHAGARHLGLS